MRCFGFAAEYTKASTSTSATLSGRAIVDNAPRRAPSRPFEF
jgi:hypothetical protein